MKQTKQIAEATLIDDLIKLQCCGGVIFIPVHLSDAVSKMLIEMKNKYYTDE